MAAVNYFSKNLSFLREAAHLSQTEIESRTGIKRNTWSNWENGKSEPSQENLFKIANFFKIDIGELLSKNLSDHKRYDSKFPKETTSEIELDYQKKPCKDCIAKEEMIALQKQTIKALEGQVEILKMALIPVTKSKPKE